MTAVGPLIVIALTTIGAIRVVKVSWLATRASVRAFGRALRRLGGSLATVGDRKTTRGITQSDVDAACEAAVKRALDAAQQKAPSKRKTPADTADPLSGETVVFSRREATGN